MALDIGFVQGSLSRYPELKDKVDKALWGELVRTATRNDELLKAETNKIHNRVATQMGISLDELFPNYKSVTDHTSYFQEALSQYDVVYLPLGSTWYVKDLVVPSYKAIFGKAPISSDPTTIDGIYPVVKKASGAVSSLFDFSTHSNIIFSGFRIDGIDKSVGLILATNADNCATSYMTLHNGLFPYGSISGYAETSTHINNWVRDCTYGYPNLQDSSVYGGTIHGCDYGIYSDNTSATFNRYLTRIEWSVEYNIYCKNASNNYYDVQSDAGREGGLYFENTARNMVFGEFRRSGRRDNVNSAHLYLKGAQDCTFILLTATGNNDSGTPPTTPKYTVIFDGTGSSNNRGLTFAGNLTGFTEQAVLVVGPKPFNVTFTGIGYETEATGGQPSNVPRNQDLGTAAFMDWKVITAGTRPLAYLTADMNSTADQTFTWVNGFTPNKYVIDSVVGHSPSANLTTAVGGVYTASVKAGVTVVPPTQVYTALSVSTNYAKLSLGTSPQQNYLTGNLLCLSLTTPQGSASTADFVVMGTILA